MRHSNWSPDQEEEWELLRQACETGENEVTDWHHGASLIPEDDFDGAYAEQLCLDLGYINCDFPAFIEVDWDKTADNMKADYSKVTLLRDVPCKRLNHQPKGEVK